MPFTSPPRADSGLSSRRPHPFPGLTPRALDRRPRSRTQDFVRAGPGIPGADAPGFRPPSAFADSDRKSARAAFASAEFTSALLAPPGAAEYSPGREPGGMGAAHE